MKITTPLSLALAAGSAIAAPAQPAASSSSREMSGSALVEVKTLHGEMPPHRRITVTHPKRGEEGEPFRTFDPATQKTFPFAFATSHAGETAAASESPVVTVTNLFLKTVIVPDTTATTTGSEMTSELTPANTTDASWTSWLPRLFTNINWFPSPTATEETSTSTTVSIRDLRHTTQMQPRATASTTSHRFLHQASPLPTPRTPLAPRDPKHKKRKSKSKHDDGGGGGGGGAFTTRARPVPFGPGSKFQGDYGTPDDECSEAWKDTLMLNFVGDHLKLEHEMANICGNKDWKDHTDHDCDGPEDESLCTMKR